MMRGSLLLSLVILLAFWSVLAAGCQAVGGRSVLTRADGNAERSVRQFRSDVLQVEAGVRDHLRPAGLQAGGGGPVRTVWPWPGPGPLRFDTGVLAVCT